ncbi:MAG: hypothetical protein JNM84_01250 [Planctomycetes bacterium]|nr:hypothetical protein [Planctomycetota bacterium]
MVDCHGIVARIPNRMIRSNHRVKAPSHMIVRAALGLHRLLERLARRVLTPEALVFTEVVRLARSEVLGALVALGVMDELRRPTTAAEIAGRLGLDADRLFRVLRAATQMGLVTLDRRGRFTATRIGRVLRSDHPSQSRELVRYFTSRGNRDAWSFLTHTLRTGENGFGKAHGTDVWTWFAEHPEERETFGRALMGLELGDAPFVASLFPWAEVAVICDVGGGCGVLLSEILLRNPRVAGVLVDAPAVLASAGQLLARCDVIDRVTLAPGSFFERVPPGHDAYLMKHILHDWDDTTCTRILGVVRQAMAPGAKALLVERLLDRHDTTSFAVLTDLQMMVACADGRERSREDFATLLRNSGFRPGRVFAGPTIAVIEGVAI